MNPQYIENYTNRTFDTINRIVNLNTLLISHMSNFNRYLSNNTYINYLSNQNQNQNQNIYDNQYDNQYYNDLYNIYNNYSIENIKNLIENNIDTSIYYDENQNDDVDNDNDDDDDDDDDENEDNFCSITKDKYINGDSIGKIKGCGHSFKYEYIFDWLKRDLRCPLCRYNILENSNLIEFKNDDEKLILTREQFINFMKYYYNINANFL